MSYCQLPEQDSDVVSHTSITVIPETSDEEDEDDIEDDQESALNLSQLQSSITHSVLFKCIGCIKEHRYQETLCRATQYNYGEG